VTDRAPAGLSWSATGVFGGAFGVAGTILSTLDSTFGNWWLERGANSYFLIEMVVFVWVISAIATISYATGLTASGIRRGARPAGRRYALRAGGASFVVIYLTGFAFSERMNGWPAIAVWLWVIVGSALLGFWSDTYTGSASGSPTRTSGTPS
jgi:hypothetical protein